MQNIGLDFLYAFRWIEVWLQLSIDREPCVACVSVDCGSIFLMQTFRQILHSRVAWLFPVQFSFGTGIKEKIMQDYAKSKHQGNMISFHHVLFSAG